MANLSVWLSAIVCGVMLLVAPASAMPAPDPDMDCTTAAEYVTSDPNLLVLLGLVPLAAPADPDFYSALSDPEAEFTLFAPTNEAFVTVLLAELGLTVEEVTALPPALVDVLLKYHITSPAITASEFEYGKSYETASYAQQYFNEVLPDQSAGLETTNITAMIPDIEGLGGSAASVVLADQIVCSAVIHVIDSVLLPFTAEQLAYIAGGGELP